MSWTKAKRNGYIVFTETGIVLADNAGATAEIVAVSSVIPADLYNWENKKLSITLTSTTASGAEVVLDAIFQVSNNDDVTGDVVGTGSATTPLWATGATADCNTTSLTLVSATAIADLTDVYAPYGRIAVKTAATDLTDAAGRVTISIAIPSSVVGMLDEDFGGIGKDPS